MGSPVKQKYKEGVQHEILTNYYLSKYDKYMSNYRDREVTTIQPTIHQYRSNQLNNPNVKRKNFKELILEKKASREAHGSREGRKNFKLEKQKKNSLQKVQKQNRKNFYELQGTIMSELYRPSPSQLERGKFEQIEVVHKISYQDKKQSNQQFHYQQMEGGEQENIFFRNEERLEEQQKPSKFEISFERIEDNKLASAIRGTFERRSPNKNRSKSREESSISKISPTNYQTKNARKVEEQAIYYENVRSSFQNIQKDRERQRQKEKDKQKNFLRNFNDNSQNSDFHKANDSSIPEDDRRSVDSRGSKISKQLSFDRNRKALNEPQSRRGSVSNSIYHDRRKNSSFHDDSFHRNVPQIEQEPKISILKAQQARDKQKFIQKEFQKEKVERSENYDSNHSEVKSIKSNVHNQSFNRQSNHEFSMISRFSMASEEGGVIKQELEKQLNQNEIGPYQNALTSLLSLLNEHPNAWPIYVVGQRILEDRHQYEAKRLGQQNQLSKIQIKIEKEKRSQIRKNQIEKNSITILKLVRKLSSLIQDH